MIQRRKTRRVTVGDDQHGFIKIGGDAPVAVQTMTAGYTYDVDALRSGDPQARRRRGGHWCASPYPNAKTPRPSQILEPGAACRSSPTCTSTSNAPSKPSKPACTRSASTPATSATASRSARSSTRARSAGVPIRIGVNEGSIVERKDKQKRMKELGGRVQRQQARAHASRS